MSTISKLEKNSLIGLGFSSRFRGKERERERDYED